MRNQNLPDVWNAVGYGRLSKDDRDKENESNSIKNQRAIIKKYVSEQADFQGAAMTDYVDDGVSGSHTDRAAYQRLMTDVARGEVDCVSSKTSRASAAICSKWTTC